MVVQTRYTIEEFDRLIQEPEYADKRLEYIGGEIVEVVSNNYSSEVAARLLVEIGVFVKNRQLGRVTGADGGYVVSRDYYIPDVAFISKAKQPEPSHDTYNPNPPDLAVEVLSPTDRPNEITVKVLNYLAAGVTVWIVNPDSRQVEVCTPDQPVQRMSIDGTVDGGDVLPGFKLAVKDIFPD